jgi:hypothetical protein
MNNKERMLNVEKMHISDIVASLKRNIADNFVQQFTINNNFKKFYAFVKIGRLYKVK